MEKLVLYRCPICGNFIAMIRNSGAVPVCCGRSMELLPVHTVDEAAEKHVPVVEFEAGKTGCEGGAASAHADAAEVAAVNTGKGAAESPAAGAADCGSCAVTVRVGAVPHPMTSVHRIEWIAVLTTAGVHFLRPADCGDCDAEGAKAGCGSIQENAAAGGNASPCAVFHLAKGEEVTAVYDYCNIHGLWMYEAGK